MNVTSPSFGRQQVGQTSVLRHHWQAAREVADAAIADPAAAGVDVHTLGDHDLGGRLSDVLLVSPWVARHVAWRDQRPAVGAKQVDIRRIAGMNIERQLEPALAGLRQGRELPEFAGPQPVGVARRTSPGRTRRAS